MLLKNYLLCQMGRIQGDLDFLTLKNGTCALATSFIFAAKVRTPFKKTFPANLFLYLFVLYIEVSICYNSTEI